MNLSVDVLWDTNHINTCRQCKGMIRPDWLEPDVPVPATALSFELCHYGPVVWAALSSTRMIEPLTTHLVRIK